VRSRAVFLVLGLPLVAYACASFESAPNPTDPADASAVEATTTDDAASDVAVSDGTTTPSRFCATSDAAFCEDFDDGGLPWKFMAPAVAGGSVDFSADEAHFASPPASVRVLAGPNSFGAMAILLAKAGTSFAVSCKHHRTSVATGLQAGVMTITIDSTRSAQFGYASGSPTLFVTSSTDAGGKTTKAVPAAGVFNDWARIELEYDFTTGHATLRVDGATAATDVAPVAPGGTTDLGFGLGGLVLGGTDSGVDVDFDDCEARWK
jgi:hypothetical protein